MSRMRRTLSVHTSLGAAINYTLQASIPSHMLTKCAAALPRPPWEPILYYSCVCIMAFLLLCTLIAAYFEADRIFTADILKRRTKLNSASQAFDRSRVFDLRYITGVRGTSAANSSIMDSKNTNNQQQKAPVREVRDVITGPRDTAPLNSQLPVPVRRRSLFLRPLVFIKSLFIRNKSEAGHSGSRLPPPNERHAWREKEVKNGVSTPNTITSSSSCSSKTPQDKASSGPDHTDNSTKINTNPKVNNSRRSKAAKRQHSDLTPNTSTITTPESSGTTASKDSKKSNHNNTASGSHSRRVVDAEHMKPSPDKDYTRSVGETKTTIMPTLVAPRKTDRITGMNQLDIIDAPDVALAADEFDDIKKEGREK